MDDDSETGILTVHNKTYDLSQLSKDERHRYLYKNNCFDRKLPLLVPDVCILSSPVPWNPINNLIKKWIATEFSKLFYFRKENDLTPVLKMNASDKALIKNLQT